jgi:hypothetical protein
MHQTGYAYGVKFAADMIFFKFEIINKGARNLDSLYFAMYLDIDAGNVSGGPMKKSVLIKMCSSCMIMTPTIIPVNGRAMFRERWALHFCARPK